MPEESAPNSYQLVIWEQLYAGSYVAVGGRFKIKYKGPGKWVLTDNTIGRQMRCPLLRDAQQRAELLVRNALQS